jgi:hypothetical protein
MRQGLRTRRQRSLPSRFPALLSPPLAAHCTPHYSNYPCSACCIKTLYSRRLAPLQPDVFRLVRPHALRYTTPVVRLASAANAPPA